MIDVNNNGKTVLGEKHFTLFNSVFELASGIQPFEIGNKNRDLVTLIKYETLIKFGHIICVFLALSSVICQSILFFYSKCGFIKYQKIFDQLIHPREKSNSHCKKILFLIWRNSGG